MAQHDYVIDNQSFPATRTDLNNVLQAIVSNNSGTSAPSTTFANQIWYDSNANILYIRNEDNDANIPLMQFDQSADVAATLATVIDILDASGTDQAGTALTIRGGAGTGTGAGGAIIFQTADGAGSTGSSVNAHATRVTITDDGKVGIGDATPETPIEINTANTLGSTFTGTTAGEGLRVTQSSYSAGNYVSLIEAPHQQGGVPNVRIAGMFDGGGSNLAFGTSNSYGSGITNTAMFISSSGNIGIGATPNSYSGFTVLTLGGSGNSDMDFEKNGTVIASQYTTSTNDKFFIQSVQDALVFQTGGSNDRLTIDSDGDVYINRNTHKETTRPGRLVVGFAGGSEGGIEFVATGNLVSTQAVFYNNTNNRVGTITTSNTTTGYNTTSDYRLKENITDLTGAIERVKTLLPKRFNFKVDPDTTVDGFLAHEVTAVPEAITGEKDGMRDEQYAVTPAKGEIFTEAKDATYDKDGNELTAATDEIIHSTNVEEPDELADGQLWREKTAAKMGTRSVPDYQGIDQSKLVPLLTAALQEAIAKIETLETKVAALEG